MTVPADSLFLSRPEVAAREIDDGAVLVNMNSGGCFELNRIGFEIWKLLQQKTTIAGVCEALADRYPVAREVLIADAKDLIDALLRSGLVEVSSGK
jgi:hypothetical protein